MLTTEQAAYELAFQVAEGLIRSGTGSASTTKSLLSIFRKTDLREVTVTVTMGQVTISHQEDPTASPVTRVHEVDPGPLDIRLRVETGKILESFVLGEMSAEDGICRMRHALSVCENAGHHRTALGFMVIGVGFSLLLGGGLVTTVSAGVGSLVAFGAWTLVNTGKAPGIFSLAAGGLSAVIVATLSGIFFSTSQTAVCVVAPLAAWLSGIASYGAVHDIITGWYLSACGRILTIVTSTAGLVAGVTLGIHLLSPVVGESMHYIETLEADTARWSVAVLGAVLVSLGFAVSAWGNLAKSACLGALGGLVQLGVLVLGAAGASSYTAILAVAILSGIVAVAITRLLGLASNATVTVVLLPLFPGMMVYQGVLGTIFAVDGAGKSLLEATITAFCLCMGAVLGQYLASELLWAARRRQFHISHPGQVFHKQMAEEHNFSDIMVPIFSKPFSS